MSMNIGVSGLKAAQQELDVTGHNIANVDVVGFKSFRSMFADVYAESGGKMAQVSGVLTQGTSQRFNQGILQTTGSSLDMGIEGSGFFVLSGDGNTFYSRAGYFGLSRNDDLVNNQGFKVQGFQVDDKGEVVAGALGDIHIERKSIPARATSQISAAINLDARDSTIPAMVFDEQQPSSYNWATTFGLYDSLGVPHQLTLFTVLADSDSSTWDLFYRLDNQMLKDVSDPAHPVFRKDQLAFNGDGSIKSRRTGYPGWKRQQAFRAGTGRRGSASGAEPGSLFHHSVRSGLFHCSHQSGWLHLRQDECGPRWIPAVLSRCCIPMA